MKKLITFLFAASIAISPYTIQPMNSESKLEDSSVNSVDQQQKINSLLYEFETCKDDSIKKRRNIISEIMLLTNNDKPEFTSKEKPDPQFKVFGLNLLMEILQVDAQSATVLAKIVLKNGIYYEKWIIFLLDSNPLLTHFFASRTNKNNIHTFSSMVKKIISIDPSYLKYFEKIIDKPNLQKEVAYCYLLDPQKAYDNFSLKLKLGFYDKKKEPKTLGFQEFIRLFEEREEKNYSPQLKEDYDARITVAKVLEKEHTEHKKGRYSLYHGRESDRFVRDQVFLYLLEIFLARPIDKTSWHTLHWDVPGSSLPYENLQKVFETPTYSSPHYEEKFHFLSDLFGIKEGGSALSYVLNNENSNLFGNKIKSVKQLFGLFGWDKYYQKGETEFENAEKLAQEFQYGTLLQYVFTENALEEFTFATAGKFGMKIPIKIETDDFSVYRQIPNNSKQIIDILVNKPEIIYEDQDKKYEYVMIVCDDSKDGKKLGSSNPFNQNIRVYSYNLGDDSKVATKIKEQIKLAFIKIKLAMLKDGVIKKPLILSKL